MATLGRITGKVFGSQAPADEIGVFGSAKDGHATLSSNVSDIQNYSTATNPDAYLKGWGSGVVSSENFPPMEEVTGVLKTISYQTCYLLQEGIPAYDSGTEYSATSIVKNFSGSGDLEFYKSLHDNNSGNPLSSTEDWEKASIIGQSDVGVPQITCKFDTLPDKCVWLEGQDDDLTNPLYPQLRDIYQTTYNTSLTPAGKYSLPDFRNRAIWGATSAGYIAAGLPNITGNVYFIATNENWQTVSGSTGAFQHFAETTDNTYGQKIESGTATASSKYSGRLYFAASRSNSIYGGSTTVQPPAIKVRVYTRYE